MGFLDTSKEEFDCQTKYTEKNKRKQGQTTYTLLMKKGRDSSSVLVRESAAHEYE